MKRFYCSVCSKMKRVRKWPRRINHSDSISPTERVGECNYHSMGFNSSNSIPVVKVVQRKRA